MPTIVLQKAMNLTQWKLHGAGLTGDGPVIFNRIFEDNYAGAKPWSIENVTAYVQFGHFDTELAFIQVNQRN